MATLTTCFMAKKSNDEREQALKGKQNSNLLTPKVPIQILELFIFQSMGDRILPSQPLPSPPIKGHTSARARERAHTHTHTQIQTSCATHSAATST